MQKAIETWYSWSPTNHALASPTTAPVLSNPGKSFGGELGLLESLLLSSGFAYSVMSKPYKKEGAFLVFPDQTPNLLLISPRSQAEVLPLTNSISLIVKPRKTISANAG